MARALRPLRILTRFEALRFLGRITGGALGMIMRAALFCFVVLFGFGKEIVFALGKNEVLILLNVSRHFWPAALYG